MSQEEELRLLRARVSKLTSALTRASKAIHNESADAVYTIAAVHGMIYTGPTFTRKDYLDALKP